MYACDVKLSLCPITCDLWSIHGHHTPLILDATYQVWLARGEGDGRGRGPRRAADELELLLPAHLHQAGPVAGQAEERQVEAVGVELNLERK